MVLHMLQAHPTPRPFPVELGAVVDHGHACVQCHCATSNLTNIVQRSLIGSVAFKANTVPTLQYCITIQLACCLQDEEG